MSTTHHGITFDRTVNAVDELGWDPDGNEPIDIPDDDDLLIEVPEGEYVFEGTGSKHGVVEGTLRNWGLRGLGDHWTDVTFRTANGQSTRFVNSSEQSNGILLENLTFDQTDSRTGGDIGNTFRAQDNVEVHDVEVVGMSAKETHCRWTVRPHIVDPDGVANFVNYRKKGPSVFVGHGGSDGGGGAFTGHKGTANFVRCWIANQGGDGGLYTGKHAGSVNFYGCYFANNDMALMRMGAGSEMHNCLLVADWDAAHPENVVIDDPEPTGMNGIYMASAQHGKSGGGLYGCDINFKEVQSDGMAVLMINTSDAPDAIEDCRVRVDVDDMPPLKCGDPADQRLPNHEAPDEPWSVRIDGLHLTGSGSMTGYQGDGVNLSNRDDSVLRDIHVDIETDLDTVVNPENCSGLTTEDIHIGEGTAEEPAREPQAAFDAPIPDGATEAGLVGSPGESESNSDSDSTDDTMSDDTTDSGSDSGIETPAGRLKLVGQGDNVWYHVRATDAVDPEDRANLNDPSDDPLSDKIVEDGQAAVGALGDGGVDTFTVGGEIEALSIAGAGAAVTLGGDPVDPSELPDVDEPAWPDDRTEGWTSGEDGSDSDSDSDGDSGSSDSGGDSDSGSGGTDDGSGDEDGTSDDSDGSGSDSGESDGSDGEDDSGSSDDSSDDSDAPDLQTLTIEAPADLAGIAHYSFRATGGVYPTHSGSFTVTDGEHVIGHMQRGWTETFAFSGELDVQAFHDELDVSIEDSAPQGL